MFDYVLNTRLSLVVNKIWVDEEPISLIRMKNQQKVKVLLNGSGVVNAEQWTKNFECLYCHEVEVVEYFELLDMRYGDKNAVTQRV